MKRLLLALAMAVAGLASQAQQLTFWQKVNHFLTKPALVDTSCIYRRPAGFSLGLFSTGQKAGIDVTANFELNLEGQGTMTGSTKYNLTEDICKKVGLEIGYGNVNLGYGIEVGPKSAWKKRSLGFNILGKSWGVHVNYFKISNKFMTKLSTKWDYDTVFHHDEMVNEEPAVMKELYIDGYYVFNNKRFAYPAVYKTGLVQRHTAGSWMLAARYMQGSLYNSPEASWDSYNMLDCFYTLQGSIGGGYSVNFVFWHRDPTGPHMKGLRNITLNLTAMPMITLANYMKTSSYEYDESGANTGEKESKVWCYPVPNYIGSAGLCFSVNRFLFSAQFTYNRFYFRSSHAFNANQVEMYDFLDHFKYIGVFHDWTLKGLLVYCF